jgi:hypothetical protein
MSATQQTSRAVTAASDALPAPVSAKRTCPRMIGELSGPPVAMHTAGRRRRGPSQQSFQTQAPAHE